MVETAGMNGRAQFQRLSLLHAMARVRRRVRYSTSSCSTTYGTGSRPKRPGSTGWNAGLRTPRAPVMLAVTSSHRFAGPEPKWAFTILSASSGDDWGVTATTRSAGASNRGTPRRSSGRRRKRDDLGATVLCARRDKPDGAGFRVPEFRALAVDAEGSGEAVSSSGGVADEEQGFIPGLPGGACDAGRARKLDHRSDLEAADGCSDVALGVEFSFSN